ncbi:MAG: hypothetical protein FWG88_03075 [Oscillospiraceae bacterium]|nr:hypothetical protein [Oscillospiraceae bacterium]
MKLTLQQTEKLLKGHQSFSQLGFSMMVTRLRTVYIKDSSQTTVEKSMNEINMFLNKFGTIMEADFAIIIKM